MRLYQEKHLVPLLFSADIVAGVDSDSFNMANYHHASINIMFGPSYAGANPSIVTVYEGASVGAKTSIVTDFPYTYTSGAIGAASADVFEAESTSSALSIARATMVSRMLTIELSADALTTGTYSWVTVQLGAEADAGECSILAVLYPRFAYSNLTALV